MKEVKKCSISGVAFTMDTDAYEELNDYLESLKRAYEDTPDGAEIVADIEARIAELILSTQDNTRVVEKPLIANIIAQMGTPEDITEDVSEKPRQAAEPRIPRRLYRDSENAKLGGVCSGIGKYFDLDPVWVRLAMFLPLLLSWFGWIPFLHWAGPMMGNLFGIFVICYFIMWFAVPMARTARQKLEMNGEKITANSIRENTVSSSDPDSKAKPIVAEAVSVFGKVVLILLKLIAGVIVFGLIMAACALIIGLFAVSVGGQEMIDLGVLSMGGISGFSVWLPALGIIVALIPVILLIYVLMCLIASRKPGGKAVLVIFLLWLASIIACSVVAIRENIGERIHHKSNTTEQILGSEVIIDGDTTTVERLLEDNKGENVIKEGRDTIRISVPSKNINITVNKKQASLTISEGDKKVTIKAETDSLENPANASMQIRTITTTTKKP